MMLSKDLEKSMFKTILEPNKPEFFSKITQYKKNLITDEIADILNAVPLKNNKIENTINKLKKNWTSDLNNQSFKDKFILSTMSKLKLDKLLSKEKKLIKMVSPKMKKKLGKYKMMKKNLHSKINSYKFKTNNKLFKTMTKKINKLYVEHKKDTQKSIKTIKKPIKGNSKEEKLLFRNLSINQRKSRLSDLNRLLSDISKLKYSDEDFFIKKDIKTEFVDLLNELLEFESDKLIKISYLKLLRNFSTSYNELTQTIPLKNGLTTE
jgi:hypothetical protein